MAGPTLTIQPPTRASRLGGIMQVAEVRVNARVGIGQNVKLISAGCEFPNTEVLRCFAEAEVPDKTYDPIVIDDAVAEPFVIFAGVQCHLSADVSDYLPRARQQLEDGQGRVLEDALESWGVGGTALAAGGSPTGAIARVDQELDDKYIGRGVILMSRFDAVLAAANGALKDVNGVPTTINGTPVIASGRVAPGTVYGFGSIVIEHSPVTDGEATDHETNKHFALAEATYVLAVDCEFRVKSSTAA
ncbi:hypothetical protein SEA_PHINKY_32 [Microbacterium phage Phinky]|nr:hypothetical protein SEA_PHINKY_32 [Microbacterium phage Phinky]